MSFIVAYFHIYLLFLWHLKLSVFQTDLQSACVEEKTHLKQGSVPLFMFPSLSL